MLATTVSILYGEAQEEAAELRRQLQVRTTRMKRRRIERKKCCAILAFVSGYVSYLIKFP